MKIAVVGTGYVGITTSASFCEFGHQIIGVDVDEDKIQKLRKGILPIYEPGVESIVQENLKKGTLSFTTSLEEAVNTSDVIFIAVGTPSLPDGNPNMSYVEKVAEGIGSLIDEYKVIVDKSTVPVGTADWVKSIICSKLQERGKKIEFDVVSNPEFLKEGKALEDARHPDRIVIGCHTEKARRIMEEVYRNVEAPLLITTPRNAEMIKYASNAFLATKISFMNELSRLCHSLSIDITEVAKGMGLDRRIGPQFLQAGIGYGGSCFPKDVAALCNMASEAKVELTILERVQDVNQTQADWFVQQMEQKMNGLAGKRITLLGLSFKPETDDIREAPAFKVIPPLVERGAVVTTFDPVVGSKVRELYPHVGTAADAYSAVKGADAVFLCTEWKEIVDLNWKKVLESMSGRYIFDGRNVLPCRHLSQLGFDYAGVGKTC